MPLIQFCSEIRFLKCYIFACFQTKVNEGNVENVTGTVAKITSDALTFTPTDINKIADVLEHTAGVEKVTEEVKLLMPCRCLIDFTRLYQRCLISK